MIFLAQTFWFWLALAFVLGLGFGWFLWKRGGSKSGLILWAAVLVVLTLSAWAKLLPERVGFWFDLGVMMLFCYFIGCFLAAFIRGAQAGEGSGLSQTASSVAATSATAFTMSKMPDTAPPPKVAAVAASAEAVEEGTKPVGLAAPRGGGKADDLKRIKGIGKQNEGRLHGLGIWHFDQIAAWSADEVRWVGQYLAFPGRIEREEWVSQAKILAQGGETEFSKRADAGEVATSRDDTNDDGQGNVITVVKT